MGENLRQERVRQGLDLQSIAIDLRITQRYLECIEKDDFKSLPGTFFYKSFVRQYASRLGMDPQEVLVQADQLLEGDRPVVLLNEQSSITPRRSTSGPPAISDPILAATNQNITSQKRFGWSAIVLGVVVIGCTGFYAWWYQSGAQTESSAAPRLESPVERTAETPVRREAAPDTQMPPTQIETKPAEAVTTPAETLPPIATNVSAPPADANGITVNISANEATWIEIVSDGKRIFSGLLNASESKTLRGSEQARMVVGNAGGLSIQFNGKPISPIGPRGQVRTVQFTKENYQVIVPGQIVNQ
ncbi:MAG: DUF4115 domain-containing protein [Bryobacteraceae bacterium]|nr:DUF4115 domain-containing protein [Bryobacteraceae bacterium]